MVERKEFARKELYDLVWSTPISKLAKRFGLSDVGLRKVCVKHEIPTPPLGHWAKVQHGKKVRQTPLPAPSDKVKDRVFVSVYASGRFPTKSLQQSPWPGAKRRKNSGSCGSADAPPPRYGCYKAGPEGRLGWRACGQKYGSRRRQSPGREEQHRPRRLDHRVVGAIRREHRCVYRKPYLS